MVQMIIPYKGRPEALHEQGLHLEPDPSCARFAGKPFPAKAFANVASILDNWPEKVTSSKMLKGTKGVGKGSMAKVTLTTPPHHEIWKYQQSANKVHGQVLQNLIVPLLLMLIRNQCQQKRTAPCRSRLHLMVNNPNRVEHRLVCAHRSGPSCFWHLRDTELGTLMHRKASACGSLHAAAEGQPCHTKQLGR